MKEKEKKTLKDNWYEEELRYESRYSAWDFDFDDARKLKEEHEEKHDEINNIKYTRRQGESANNAREEYVIPKGLIIVVSLIFSLFAGPLFPIAFVIIYLSVLKSIKEGRRY